MASSGTAINTVELFSVKGMVALITGGGTGIGLMMARALAAGGASKIYVAGRRLEVLEAAAASITATGTPGVVVPVACDVTEPSSLAALVARVDSESGHLNLLVCNSGVTGPNPSPTATTSLRDWREAQLAVPVDEFQRAFAVNATAVWYTTVACLELLDRGNAEGRSVGWSSQVVVTSSIAAFNRRAPGGWAYGQSKAAATHAVKQLAGFLPAWGIRANALCPGWFPSEMTLPLVDNLNLDDSNGLIPVDTSAVPLGRMGDQQDMAGTLLWMVSRAGAYCNGNVTLLDGGRLGNFPSTY